MRKLLCVLFVGLFVFSGCSRRAKRAPVKDGGPGVEQTSDTTGDNVQTQKSLFVDDGEVEQLSFKEKEKAKDESGSAFSPESIKEAALQTPEDESVYDESEDQEEVAVTKTAADEDQAWEARRASQAQYGFKTLYFAFDRYEIAKDQRSAFDHDAKIITKLATDGHNILLEGHTCHEGSKEYNMHLSNHRAEEVRAALIKAGVPAEKLKTVGRGSELCLVVGDRKAESVNRRVEIYVL